MNNEYKAYIRVRRISDREIVSSIGLKNLSDSHVERVMMGLLMNMGPEYFVDDSEVDAAKEATNV